MKSLSAIVVAIAWIAAQDARAAGSPEDGAKAFYVVYGTFHPSDGIPDSTARARYTSTISRSLENLLELADAAGIKFGRANKDSPPLIEGDLMTSNFEGATSFRLSGCTIKGPLATCKVDLVYDPGQGADKPVRWTDSAILVATGDGWRVDDIVYGATWAFGNRGRLSETLKRAIAEAGP